MGIEINKTECTDGLISKNTGEVRFSVSLGSDNKEQGKVQWFMGRLGNVLLISAGFACLTDLDNTVSLGLLFSALVAYEFS